MIGKMLDEILKEKNMNVRQLARLIDVSDQTLYSIIKRNNLKVSIDVLIKICNALDVDIERFYLDYISHKKNPCSETEWLLLKKYNNLNSKGQTKVDEYIDDLSGNPEYLKEKTYSSNAAAFGGASKKGEVTKTNVQYLNENAEEFPE